MAGIDTLRDTGHKTALQKAWAIAATVCDPEIPVLTIADLGILRGVELLPVTAGEGPATDDAWRAPAVRVTITPTYSGCPAMDAIRADLTAAFAAEGYARVAVDLVLSPAWSTDWLSAAGKAKLEQYGIAPPSGTAAARPTGPVRLSLAVKCPQCSSLHTRELSRFGSTSCKALYVCQDCKEPFDYFKVF